MVGIGPGGGEEVKIFTACYYCKMRFEFFVLKFVLYFL